MYGHISSYDWLTAACIMFRAAARHKTKKKWSNYLRKLLSEIRNVASKVWTKWRVYAMCNIWFRSSCCFFFLLNPHQHFPFRDLHSTYLPFHDHCLRIVFLLCVWKKIDSDTHCLQNIRSCFGIDSIDNEPQRPTLSQLLFFSLWLRLTSAPW